MLNKKSPIPLYYQIADRIREDILANKLPPGSQLPSERELTERMGVSRMTTRQAVAYLVREGLLDVRPGVGTFVTEPKLIYNARHLLGFTEEMAKQGETVSSQIIEQTLTTPSPHIAKELHLTENDHVVKLLLLRKANDTPVLLETIHLPASLCPGLENIDLRRQSLYTLLQDRYDLTLSHARQTFEATRASEYEQTLFAMPSDTVMILLEGVTYDTDERPIESFRAVYRGDRFKFTIESVRGNR